MFNFGKKPIVSADVILDAVLPEQHLAVPLTVLVIETPKRAVPLTREQKLVRWIIVTSVALALLACLATAFVAWFIATYQVVL